MFTNPDVKSGQPHQSTSCLSLQNTAEYRSALDVSTGRNYFYLVILVMNCFLFFGFVFVFSHHYLTFHKGFVPYLCRGIHQRFPSKWCNEQGLTGLDREELVPAELLNGEQMRAKAKTFVSSSRSRSPGPKANYSKALPSDYSVRLIHVLFIHPGFKFSS